MRSPRFRLTMLVCSLLCSASCPAASLSDVQSPVLSIASPITGLRVSNSVASVTGTARDNVAVAAVWFQLNTNDWTIALGSTNWIAQVALLPGTNTLRVYAVDGQGNRSLTKSTVVTYVVSGPLLLQTTGKGTVSPNYSNAVLEIGKRYTLTGSPAVGFMFTNWTSGLGGPLVTNKPTVTFAMTTNLALTANFIDVQSPVMIVTPPTTGLRVSNATVTVTGTASDNASVASVRYQLNTNEWTVAVGTTNWNTLVTLSPGTNTFRAYAVDAQGNRCLTKSVAVTYVVNGLFTLQTTGKGAVSPNYSNAVLEIGKRYTLTATPGSGFSFSNWTTGMGGPVVTNKPAAAFTMISNLVLTANFIDTQKPTLVIKTPTAAQRLSNAVSVVTGTATDNAGVVEVRVNVNNTGWQPAAGTAAWQSPMALAAGSNSVAAYAVDAAGNKSLTNTVKFTYVMTSALVVRTNGTGTISPSYNGRQLEVGKNYSLTASPAAGQILNNWTDGAGQQLTTNRLLNFVMVSDLILQANFAPNPYAAVKGDYCGLFFPKFASLDELSSTNCGSFKLSLTDQGTFSGSLLLEGATLSLSGTMDAGLQAEIKVARNGKSALTVIMHMEGSVLQGIVVCEDWGSELEARPVLTGAPNLYLGAYTLLLNGNGDPTISPPGNGVASVIIANPGSVQLSNGTLADGAPLMASGSLCADGSWPFFVSLYGGRGFLKGWLTVDTNLAVNAGELIWLKPAGVTGALSYSNGFAETRTVTLARYAAPVLPQSAVNWRYGQLTLALGDLPVDLTSDLVVTNNQAIVWYPAVSNLTITISPSSGTFSGSFKHPVSGAATSFKGVLVQTPDGDTQGTGWFLGSTQGGTVSLSSSSVVWPEDWIPLPLSGQVAQLDTVGYGASALAFGSALFQDSEGGAGSYSYTRLGNGKVRLTLNYSTPPPSAGIRTVSDVQFTAEGTGDFTTQVTTGPAAGRSVTGTFTMAPQPDIAPATLSSRTGGTLSTLGIASIAFTGSSFSGANDEGAFSGTYTYKKYSTVGGVIRLSYNAPTNLRGIVDYVEAWMTDPNAGNFRRTQYIPGYSFPYKDTGTLWLDP